MSSIISISELGKRYDLNRSKSGGYRSLRDELARLPQKIFSGRKDKKEFWALQDINLEILRGERVGIIGHNGAGKSTLLKLLSRITEPTTGKIVMRGKATSLLEVGAGFHPELTGHENIFLNGAVLGMTRSEVRTKYDEIVDFAGVENFLNTPVKRYSSGMYVRLAFSVAAHLDPEILIVDEALAVGDVDFQQKCLGKMESVSKADGRTVLFVSHNLAAVRQLCSRTVLLHRGKIHADGVPESIISSYLSINEITDEAQVDLSNQPYDEVFEYIDVQFLQNDEEVQGTISGSESMKVKSRFVVKTDTVGLRVYIEILDEYGSLVLRSFHDCNDREPKKFEKGEHELSVDIPSFLLGPKNYVLKLVAGIHNQRVCSYPEGIQKKIRVQYDENWGGPYPDNPFRGAINTRFSWKISR